MKGGQWRPQVIAEQSTDAAFDVGHNRARRSGRLLSHFQASSIGQARSPAGGRCAARRPAAGLLKPSTRTGQAGTDAGGNGLKAVRTRTMSSGSPTCAMSSETHSRPGRPVPTLVPLITSGIELVQLRARMRWAACSISKPRPVAARAWRAVIMAVRPRGRRFGWAACQAGVSPPSEASASMTIASSGIWPTK